MYVDVLGLPTITEAVQAASEMLRRGIIRAMASTNEDIDAQPKKENTERQKPSLSKPAQNAGTAGRDPASVYSAIASRARKPPSETPDTSKPEQLDSPVLIVDEKLNAGSSSLKNSSHAWSSTKKAGPSILSKRSRPQSTDANVTQNLERIFQPASKRERRTETASKSVKSTSILAQDKAPAKVISAAVPKTSVGTARTLSSSTPSSHKRIQTQLQFPSASSRLGSGPTRTQRASDSSKASLALKKTTIKGVNLVGLQKSEKREQAVPSSSSVSHAAVALVNTKKLPSAMALAARRQTGTQRLGANGLQRGVGPRGLLPAAWSKVTSKGVKSSTGIRGTTVARTSLLQRPSSGSGIIKPTGASWPTRRGELGGSISMHQTNLRRSDLSSRALARPQSSSDAMIPLPSTSVSEMKVHTIPGSEIIRGVRPNGYTVSRTGVVRPVVTFNPKPKLPHKLRQTSVEKIFEGLRDVKKMAEAESLSQALRAEQEIYAESLSRVDYRAAVTVKLRDIRK